MAFNSANACLGVHYCDHVEKKCKLNPLSVIQCPGGGDTACLKNQCEPQTAKCTMSPVKSATLCNDGNPCTADDACKLGVCVGKTSTCACTTSADGQWLHFALVFDGKDMRGRTPTHYILSSMISCC